MDSATHLDRLEIVLGIDNILFIAILVDKLREEKSSSGLNFSRRGNAQSQAARDIPAAAGRRDLIHFKSCNR